LGAVYVCCVVVGGGLFAVRDLALISRNRLARKSARNTSIRVPYTVSIVVLVVAVVTVNMFVTNTG
jgi:hypothetical protein